VVLSATHQEISSRDVRFTRRDIREFTDSGDIQLKVHCQRLEAMEYLLIQRGDRVSHSLTTLLGNAKDKAKKVMMACKGNPL
jgi:hypothetical protein